MTAGVSLVVPSPTRAEEMLIGAQASGHLPDLLMIEPRRASRPRCAGPGVDLRIQPRLFPSDMGTERTVQSVEDVEHINRQFGRRLEADLTGHIVNPVDPTHEVEVFMFRERPDRLASA